MVRSMVVEWFVGFLIMFKCFGVFDCFYLVVVVLDVFVGVVFIIGGFW